MRVTRPVVQPAEQRTSVLVRATGGEERKVVYNKEFGYSRKDVLLIGAGLIGLGYAMYYGLQATGMEPGLAGNWVQLIIFMGICVGWVSTYIFRVATKVRRTACGRQHGDCNHGDCWHAGCSACTWGSRCCTADVSSCTCMTPCMCQQHHPCHKHSAHG